MGTRRHTHARCQQCKMHIELCLCDQIPTIDITTRILLIMHHREFRKNTNTGRFANLMLANSSLHIRGIKDGPTRLRGISDTSRRLWLLFPRSDALILNRELVEADDRPITLLVPDGTWGQAKHAVRREPLLVSATAVTLPDGAPSLYRLRRDTSAERLATLEAIARALGIIEGPTIQRKIEDLFNLMVNRTLYSRDSSRTSGDEKHELENL